MKKKNGFTLVELLAVIILLAIIMTISVSVATSLINKSKQSTYDITLDEIKKNANLYIMENDDLAFDYDKTKNVEYKFITVGDLIDYGYIKSRVIGSNINETEKIEASDCIYVEKNITNKTIEKLVYDKTCTGVTDKNDICKIIENYISITIDSQVGDPVTKNTNLVNIYVCDN